MANTEPANDTTNTIPLARKARIIDAAMSTAAQLEHAKERGEDVTPHEITRLHAVSSAVAADIDDPGHAMWIIDHLDGSKTWGPRATTR